MPSKRASKSCSSSARVPHGTNTALRERQRGRACGSPGIMRSSQATDTESQGASPMTRERGRETRTAMNVTANRPHRAHGELRAAPRPSTSCRSSGHREYRQQVDAAELRGVSGKDAATDGPQRVQVCSQPRRCSTIPNSLTMPRWKWTQVDACYSVGRSCFCVGTNGPPSARYPKITVKRT